MEIRDPVHGSIHISPEEAPIIRGEFFQRLRSIKQLGLSEYVFPGATHTRFIHSLGVMHIGEKAFRSLFKDFMPTPELERLKETFKLACLLHDVGHAPLSHSTESVMPTLRALSIPKEFLREGEDLDRQATHEDYTIKSIADSSFAENFKLVEEHLGVKRKHIADLIRGKTNDDSYFTVGGLNLFPILSQLVSSEMDCDRMDYLLRDSYFCGVSYGNYDLDWLIDNLAISSINGSAYLGISERAVVTFDDFLLSRYHMFLQVYFHYRSVCLEQLLLRYFKTSDEYRIPGDIEAYIEHDDHFLMKIMRNSKNEYAQAIVKNRIPTKIYESFNPGQEVKLGEIEAWLSGHKVDYIKSSSAGRLSKYYRADATQTSFPIKVVRDHYGSKEKMYTDINEATDLFLKFSKSHQVNRLHCDLGSLPKNVREELIGLLAPAEGPLDN